MNTEIRREIKRFVQHYGPTDTRKLIAILSAAYGRPRQAMAADLRWYRKLYTRAKLEVIIPGIKSVAGYDI